MKKRLSIVLALALAFVLMMSSVVMAAPNVGSLISNELTGTFGVPALVPADRINEGSTKVPRVAFTKNEAEITYTLNFTLDKNGNIIDADTLQALNSQIPGPGGTLGVGYHEFRVYRPDDSVTWVKFTAAPWDNTGEEWVYEGKLWGETHITPYIPVADKDADDNWKPRGNLKSTFTIEWYTGENGELVAVETLEFNRVDNCIIPEVPEIELSWDQDEINIVDSPFFVEVTAKNKGENPIENVLYIAEVEGEGIVEAVEIVNGEVGQSLGYDEEGDFWFWGDRDEGFTFNYERPVTTKFRITANPGVYKVKIYAVQLDVE